MKTYHLISLALAGSTVLFATLSANHALAQATDLVCSECVQTTDVAPNAVNNSKIANGAVNAAKLAANAVTVAKIANNSITTPKLTTASVTRPKIAPNAINANKIANAAVTAAKIAPGAINATKLANSAVTFEKLASDVLLQNTLFVSADSTQANNCNDLRDALAEAGSIAAPEQKVLVRLDTGTFDCGSTGITVPANVILEGGGNHSSNILFNSGATAIVGSVEGALVSLNSATELRRLDIRNILSGTNSDSTAIRDLTGGGFLLEDLTLIASADSGNAYGVLLSEDACGLFGCNSRILRRIEAIAITSSGTNTVALNFDQEMTVSVEQVTVSASGGSGSSVGVSVTNNAIVSINNSHLNGVDSGVSGSPISSTSVRFSQLSSTGSFVSCAYVTDLDNIPAAGGANACP